MKDDDYEVRKIVLKANVAHPFSLVYLSDFHFNNCSEPVADWMLKQITGLRPDLILLGGDYADTRKGLRILNYFLGQLPKDTPCLAVAGNHDYFRGIATISQLMSKHRVQWLEHRSAQLNIGVVPLMINGNQKELSPPSPTPFHILCVHNPRRLNGSLEGYQLALAGHLHGSQFVLWRCGQALYPGKLFYHWNVLSRNVDGCACYVSKGLGDTLPLRYNCKKDAIFVEIFPL